MTMYLPIIIALVLYFTGIPIAYALMAGTLYYFGFVDTTSKTYLLLQKFITSTQSFPLLAIPFFIIRISSSVGDGLLYHAARSGRNTAKCPASSEAGHFRFSGRRCYSAFRMRSIRATRLNGVMM